MKIDQDEQINDSNTLVIFNFQDSAADFVWKHQAPFGSWVQRYMSATRPSRQVLWSYAKSRTGRPADPQPYTQLTHAHV